MIELSYKNFEEYELKDFSTIGFRKNPLGIQHIFTFPNGYGASIIKNFGSYGNRQDLFELAVIAKVDENNWDLCYTTEITDDVIGYLTNDEVLELLERIKNLK